MEVMVDPARSEEPQRTINTLAEILIMIIRTSSTTSSELYTNDTYLEEDVFP
jgi:hypothetical protein